MHGFQYLNAFEHPEQVITHGKPLSKVVIISLVEILLGISALSACFEYDDIVERLRFVYELRNNIIINRYYLNSSF